MGTLAPIEKYATAAKLKREHFIGQYPHPFLVHATGELQRLDPERRDDLTSDRLVLQTPRKSLHEAMLAAPVVPRDPDNDRVTIGVAVTCDIVLDDASVSKRHAWLAEVDGVWQLHDADSTGGTQVNNEPIAPGTPRTLVSGDRITLGYVDVTFLAADGFYDLVHGLLG